MSIDSPSGGTAHGQASWPDDMAELLRRVGDDQERAASALKQELQRSIPRPEVILTLRHILERRP